MAIEQNLKKLNKTKAANLIKIIDSDQNKLETFC